MSLDTIKSIHTIKTTTGQNLVCLICQHPASLPDLQNIEKSLLQNAARERSRIIHHLEKKTDPNLEFQMEFLHLSVYSQLNTINICRTCYLSAKEGVAEETTMKE